MNYPNYPQDTIAAISTPLGEAGIGIVRLSGKGALKIADKIFAGKDKVKPSQFKTYTIHYGLIKDKDGAEVDEVILSVMRSPRSYTREDIVEINCHSGIAVLKKTLDLVLDCGARLAEPGEFTKRAFLNGRIDLTQAEAVLDIIKARTDKALALSLGQLKGGLSKEIMGSRERLLNILCIAEANIDFPEEEIEGIGYKELILKLAKVKIDLKELIDAGCRGKIFRTGALAAICGRPNVGKSSLFNALLRHERSIVTHIAGTTRDTIEETIDIKGVPVRIVDTAGIVRPRDIIERKAIKKAKQYIDMADIVLLVFDGSQKLSYADHQLIRKLKSRPVLALINKCDLKHLLEKEKIVKHFGKAIEVSALRGKNIGYLEENIAKTVWDGKLDASGELISISSRQQQLLKSALKFVHSASDSAQRGGPLELVAEGLKSALRSLDQIRGEGFYEEVLDKIFNKFCIGK